MDVEASGAARHYQAKHRTFFPILRNLKSCKWLILSCLASPALAATTSEQIRQAAEDFLAQYAQSHQQTHPEHQVQSEIGAIDDRLQLADCDTPLDSRFTRPPEKSSNITLEVSCNGTHSWRLFLAAKLEIHGPALITRSALPRGTRLDARYLDRKTRVINGQQRTPILNLSAVEGAVLRRAVAANTLLTADLIEMPALVRRNDRVVISARSGPITVESWGIALSDGHLDAQIDVRNEQSGKVVRGRVTGQGRIEITF